MKTSKQSKFIKPLRFVVATLLFSSSTIMAHETHKDEEALVHNCLKYTVINQEQKQQKQSVSNSELKLVGYDESCSTPEKIDVPKEVNGMPVTEIGKRAFFEKKEIKELNLTIDSKLKKIGSHAFWKASLTNLLLPDSLEVIELGAFGLNQIRYISFGKNLKKIGEIAFLYQYIKNSDGKEETVLDTTLNLPDSLEIIDHMAFTRNKRLTLKFGKNLKTIGKRAFMWTDIAGDLHFPDSLLSIGDSAFAFTANYLKRHHLKKKTIVFGSGLQKIEKLAFDKAGITGELTLPPEIEVVEKNTFSDNYLTTVSFDKHIRYVKDDSFSGNCLDLKGGAVQYHRDSSPFVAPSAFDYQNLRDIEGCKEDVIIEALIED